MSQSRQPRQTSVLSVAVREFRLQNHDAVSDTTEFVDFNASAALNVLTSSEL